jgi:hypothetical protein
MNVAEPVTEATLRENTEMDGYQIAAASLHVTVPVRMRNRVRTRCLIIETGKTSAVIAASVGYYTVLFDSSKS